MAEAIGAVAIIEGAIGAEVIRVEAAETGVVVVKAVVAVTTDFVPSVVHAHQRFSRRFNPSSARFCRNFRWRASWFCRKVDFLFRQRHDILLISRHLTVTIFV
jgi:hypothetical protein